MLFDFNTKITPSTYKSNFPADTYLHAKAPTTKLWGFVEFYESVLLYQQSSVIAKKIPNIFSNHNGFYYTKKKVHCQDKFWAQFFFLLIESPAGEYRFELEHFHRPE